MLTKRALSDSVDRPLCKVEKLSMVYSILLFRALVVSVGGRHFVEVGHYVTCTYGFAFSWSFAAHVRR